MIAMTTILKSNPNFIMESRSPHWQEVYLHQQFSCPEKLPFKFDIGLFKMVSMKTILATGTKPHMKVLVSSLAAASKQSFSFIGPVVLQKITSDYFIIATILDVQPKFCYKFKKPTLVEHCIQS